MNNQHSVFQPMNINNSLNNNNTNDLHFLNGPFLTRNNLLLFNNNNNNTNDLLIDRQNLPSINHLLDEIDMEVNSSQFSLCNFSSLATTTTHDLSNLLNESCSLFNTPSTTLSPLLSSLPSSTMQFGYESNRIKLDLSHLYLSRLYIFDLGIRPWDWELENYKKTLVKKIYVNEGDSYKQYTVYPEKYSTDFGIHD